MSEITRNQIEKMLWEATGFQGDSAHIDAIMAVVDTYAAQQSEALSASPPALRESHYHLLIQQAELLLDSGGRLMSAASLAEAVQGIAELSLALAQRVQELEQREQPHYLPPVEVIELDEPAAAVLLSDEDLIRMEKWD